MTPTMTICGDGEDDAGDDDEDGDDVMTLLGGWGGKSRLFVVYSNARPCA